ncbi:MAG: hypothetical protein A3H96_14270 [Acidobacteria bacterium RIFCSPLOWO2_02_FULL_67_36]|nr:MAG: hypothetical protein A3H96_14270 [Acidobacteria bacterium RIFCSPLOWO2_02_FULL_67_36]
MRYRSGIAITASLCLALLYLAAPPLGGRQAVVPDAAIGLILGRVVDADSGAPLSGVVITALGFGGDSPAPTPSAGPGAILTDSDGRFVVRSLPKASYVLLASVGGTGYSPNGFLVTGMGHQIGAYLNGAFGQARPGGPLRTIDLGAGQRLGDVVIRLWKGGAINGHVLDEAGEPLVGVIVSAVSRASDGRLFDGPTTRTDDRGMYRLGTLTPGQYVVVVPQTQTLMPSSMIESLLAGPQDLAAARRLSSAAAPQVPEAGVRIGGAVLSTPAEQQLTNSVLAEDPATTRHVYPTTFHPSALGASRAAPISLRSGEERLDVDVQLRPVRTVEVSGVLLDSDGPVPGFGVHLMPAESGDADGAGLLEAAATATDARGAFLFPLVPPGSYTLLAVRIGPAAGGRGAAAGAPRRTSEAPGASATLPVAVGNEKIDGLTLTLRPGVRISGRVEFQGGGERPSADLLQDLPVELRRVPKLFRLNPGFAAGRIAPAGEFAFDGVSPGRYELHVFDVPKPGALPIGGILERSEYKASAFDMPEAWSLQSITAGGHELPDGVLPVGDGDVADVVIVFTDRPAELNGSLAVPGTNAELNRSVFVFPADRARWSVAAVSTRAFRTARVSATGAFGVPNMVPGEYYVAAAEDAAVGNWPDPTVLSKLAESAITVRLAANQKLAITLRQVVER